MASCVTYLAYYVNQWSPCCRLGGAEPAKGKPMSRKKFPSRKYNRRQQAEVDRARMKVRQRSLLNTLAAVGGSGRTERPTSERRTSGSMALNGEDDEEAATRPKSLGAMPDQLFAAKTAPTQRVSAVEEEVKPRQVESPAHGSDGGRRPAIMNKMRAVWKLARPVSRRDLGLRSPTKMKALPDPKGAHWDDLVQLMPVVDDYEREYFEERLRAYSRPELMDTEAKGNTILHYAVSKLDTSSVNLILARINDPTDVVALIDKKNDDGQSASQAASKLQSNKAKYDILRAFDDAKRFSVVGSPSF
mmetsp:Transcript_3880/g.11890  ORF Transcript_3880/g.11890 Transcript_3880/m.11890 type:complete len:303 (-) Transcript_3880:501-1409(-)